MLKSEEQKLKKTDYIYDLNFRLFTLTGFGILENPTKWKKRFYFLNHLIAHLTYVGFTCLYCIDAYLVRNDKEKLNFNLCVTLFAALSIMKMWTLMPKLKMVAELRRKFRENFNLVHVGNEKAHEDILESSARTFSLTVKSLYFLAIPALIVFTIAPFVDKSGDPSERKYCLPFPILKHAPSPIYELVYTYQVILLIHFVLLNVLSNDLMIISFLIRICGQLDILMCNISKVKDFYPSQQFGKFIAGYKSAISDYQENYYDESHEKEEEEEEGGEEQKMKRNFHYSETQEEDKERRKGQTIKLLRQNIIHHNCILKQMDDINHTYGSQLLIQGTAGALMISIVAFDIILQSRKLNLPILYELFYVGAICTDIFLLCYYGTQISEKSEKVAKTLYDTPWQQMDASNQKICSIMIAKCRRYPKLRAKYFFKLDLETYQSLVQTSYNVMCLLNETK